MKCSSKMSSLSSGQGCSDLQELKGEGQYRVGRLTKSLLCSLQRYERPHTFSPQHRRFLSSLTRTTPLHHAQAHQGCEERDLELLVVNREISLCLHLQERKRGAFQTTLTPSHLSS
jgi:hypothetical protein